MCGIVGVAGPQEDDWIAAMSGMIAHRGPDDSEPELIYRLILLRGAYSVPWPSGNAPATSGR